MSEHHKDYLGAKMGMWLFLFTELFLFGGLFLLYAVTLDRFPAEFHEAGKKLDVVFGTLNTVVLITSSLTAVLSVVALQQFRKRMAEWLIAATVLLAGVFLVNKYFEWSAKFSHGIYPGSEHLAQGPEGEAAFFALYYMMTGLHGVHVVVGMAVFIWVWLMIRTDRVTGGDYVALENSGLYWHLVDLIWIYLFPLFYLIA